jgi:hypothetical protein
MEEHMSRKHPEGHQDDLRPVQSPEFRRSVAMAAGELMELSQQHGGTITAMTFKGDREGEVERPRPPGFGHWDASQLPDAISWIVTFVGGGATGAGASWFLKNGRERIKRLMTLAGLSHIKLKDGGLSLDIDGATDIDAAVHHFERLRQTKPRKAKSTKLADKRAKGVPEGKKEAVGRKSNPGNKPRRAGSKKRK